MLPLDYILYIGRLHSEVSSVFPLYISGTQGALVCVYVYINCSVGIWKMPIWEKRSEILPYLCT